MLVALKNVKPIQVASSKWKMLYYGDNFAYITTIIQLNCLLILML